MTSRNIPIVQLNTHPEEQNDSYHSTLLENEIADITVEHVALSSNRELKDVSVPGHKSIYIFLKGLGNIDAEAASYEAVPESIFLPNNSAHITIKPSDGESLHYLKISCKLSAQDLIDIEKLPSENTQNVYFAKFTDCQSYSEAIKSPNTVSRTILSNEFIPRVAMGTVQTKGPDAVAAHKHPMLEQLFLGLSENNCVVSADDAHVEFPPFSLLHIPLGSSHSVSVDKDKVLYYVWMDFFLDKQGEEWLNTHQHDSD